MDHRSIISELLKSQLLTSLLRLIHPSGPHLRFRVYNCFQLIFNLYSPYRRSVAVDSRSNQPSGQCCGFPPSPYHYILTFAAVYSPKWRNHITPTVHHRNWRRATEQPQKREAESWRSALLSQGRFARILGRQMSLSAHKKTPLWEALNRPLTCSVALRENPYYDLQGNRRSDTHK